MDIPLCPMCNMKAGRSTNCSPPEYTCGNRHRWYIKNNTCYVQSYIRIDQKPHQPISERKYAPLPTTVEHAAKDAYSEYALRLMADFTQE